MVNQSQFIEMFGDYTINPKGWPVESFDGFARIDATMTTDYDKYADYPHIGVDSIEKKTGILSGYRTVKEDNVISGKYLFSPKHIIYSKIRPNLNKVALPDFYGVCSADAYPILPIEGKCDRIYLAYLMRSDFFLSYILKFSARSNMPKVNREQIRGFRAPLPPFESQKKFSDIVKRADKSKFAGFKSQFIEMFECESIGNCKWPTKTFGELFDISSSRRILKDDWDQKGIPFLRVRDLIYYSQTGELRNEFFVSESFYNRLKDSDGKVQDGDILISATSTIGKCLVVQNGEKYYYKDADVLRFREKEPINKFYFTYGISMPTVENQINDTIGKTTVGHFLISKAATIKQPLPPIELQETFESLVNHADKSKFELKKAIEKIDKVMRALMQ